MAPVVSWSPDDWQQFCQELFAARHGADYQSVPDRVHGDWGVEGYTSDGVVYQCYAPEEPLTTKALHEALRDKLTADIAKLIKNSTQIVALVGPNCIRCWILVTPRVEDKEILRHAASKAAEVIGEAIDGVCEAFFIRVHTLADFAAERRALGELLTLHAPMIDAGDDEEVARFATAEGLDVDTLDTKLRVLLHGHPDGDVRSLRGEYLRQYVEGAELDDWFRRAHPPLWEKWDQSRRRMSRQLAIDEITATDGPKPRLRRVTAELTASASRSIEGVQTGVAKQLALGTVATWLLDCPLGFRESNESQL